VGKAIKEGAIGHLSLWQPPLGMGGKPILAPSTPPFEMGELPFHSTYRNS